MKMQILNTENAPAPVGPYSQSVRVGDFLYCSGQIALDPKTGDLKTSDIETETRQVMSNVEAVLNNAGLDFSHIFKTTIFLNDMNDFSVMNKVYSSYFKTDPPARSCVAVETLPKNVNVEVEVIAYFQ